jgi:hypothetical protein
VATSQQVARKGKKYKKGIAEADIPDPFPPFSRITTTRYQTTIQDQLYSQQLFST